VNSSSSAVAVSALRLLRASSLNPSLWFRRKFDGSNAIGARGGIVQTRVRRVKRSNVRRRRRVCVLKRVSSES
jgi:hypothetical protein